MKIINWRQLAWNKLNILLTLGEATLEEITFSKGLGASYADVHHQFTFVQKGFWSNVSINNTQGEPAGTIEFHLFSRQVLQT